MAGIIFLDILNRAKRRRNIHVTNTNGSRGMFKSKEKSEWSTRPGDHEKCRICLNDEPNTTYIAIFEEKNGFAIAENIRKFGDIEISEGDSLPKVLCQNCHNLLQGAVQFWQQAQASDRRLRAPIKVSNNNDIMDRDADEPPNAQNYELMCKKCLKKFANIKDLSEHRSLECEQRVPCPECQQPLSRRELRTHRARAHAVPAEKPFVCDICGKCFTLKGGLQAHMMIHSDELSFGCKLCPYRGRFAKSLKCHMRVHTGEKPYACDQCPSRFVDVSNLRKHRMRHLGHQFKCEKCERGFYTQQKLQEHLRIDHTGMREHKCDICDKEYAHRKYLMRHTMTVHKRSKLLCGRLPLYLQMENKRRVKQQSREDGQTARS